jgi:hypothetical protein
MVRTGDWLVPARPGGELTKKPPLFYWAAAAARPCLPGPPEARHAAFPSRCSAPQASWHLGRRAAALPRRRRAARGAHPRDELRVGACGDEPRASTWRLAAPLTMLLAAWCVALARPESRAPPLVAVAALATALGVLGKGPIAVVLPAVGDRRLLWSCGSIARRRLPSGR